MERESLDDTGLGELIKIAEEALMVIRSHETDSPESVSSHREIIRTAIMGLARVAMELSEAERKKQAFAAIEKPVMTEVPKHELFNGLIVPPKHMQLPRHPEAELIEVDIITADAIRLDDRTLTLSADHLYVFNRLLCRNGLKTGDFIKEMQHRDESFRTATVRVRTVLRDFAELLSDKVVRRMRIGHSIDYRFERGVVVHDVRSLLQETTEPVIIAAVEELVDLTQDVFVELHDLSVTELFEENADESDQIELSDSSDDLEQQESIPSTPE